MKNTLRKIGELSILRKSLIILIGIAWCGNALSLESITGKVTLLEPTYLPGSVNFIMDTGSTSCPAGSYLKWSKADQNNNRAVYSTLLTALVSGKRVEFFINDGDTGCSGQFLHLKNE